MLIAAKITPLLFFYVLMHISLGQRALQFNLIGQRAPLQLRL